MPLDIFLFILRLAAAVALYAFLVALLITLARDVSSATRQAQLPARSAGALIIVGHDDEVLLEAGARYPLAPLTTLGRASTCSVVIPDSFASNDHAHVFQRGGQWWLEDMHSRNGTVLNDVPVSEPMVLSSGDVISIGRVKLRVEF
jgi:FHA domain-containing protein